VVLGGALLATVAGLAGALFLGSWAFDTHRYLEHEGRLRRLQEKQPRLEVVVQALQEEGRPLVGLADDEAELRALAARDGGTKAQEVIDKGRAFGRTRVFRAPDIVYFIYFDREGVMRDFTCVNR
jgi:hypothetical protein